MWLYLRLFISAVLLSEKNISAVLVCMLSYLARSTNLVLGHHFFSSLSWGYYFAITFFFVPCVEPVSNNGMDTHTSAISRCLICSLRKYKQVGTGCLKLQARYNHVQQPKAKKYRENFEATHSVYFESIILCVAQCAQLIQHAFPLG